MARCRSTAVIPYAGLTLIALTRAVSASASGTTQIELTINTTPSCAGCTITHTRVVTLPDSVGVGARHTHARIAIDSRGRYYLTGNSPRVFVFDSAGRLVAVLGKAGTGTGEYQQPFVRIGPGDTVHVFDFPAGKRTVLSPAYKVLRTLRMSPVPGRPLLLADGRYYVHRQRTPRDRAITPVSLVDTLGRIIRESGSPVGVVGEEGAVMATRYLGRGPDAHVWTIRTNRYVLEQWDSVGPRKIRLVGDPAWFKRWLVQPRGAPESARPTTEIVGIRESRDGLVWTMAYVPDANWKRREPKPGPRRVVPPADHDLYYDTIVEVLDPTTATILVSQRFPQYLTHDFIDDGVVASYRLKANGDVLIDVQRLKVTGLPGAGM